MQGTHSSDSGSEKESYVKQNAQKKRLTAGPIAKKPQLLIPSFIVIALNLGTIYAWDEDHAPTGMSDDAATNTLQFVAKLHEILVIASLSSILLHHIRKRLLAKGGLPFGLLSSGYQASSVEYLCSRGLWAAFRSEKLLILTITTLIVFSNTIGPSSAILLIPSLDWWPVPNAFAPKPIIYLPVGREELYPSAVGPPDPQLSRLCRSNDSAVLESCSNDGFWIIDSWSALLNTQGVEHNISMTNSWAGTRRNVDVGELDTMHGLWRHLTQFDFPEQGRNAAVSTLSHSSTGLPGYLSDFVRYNSMGAINGIKRPKILSEDLAPVDAPYVQVQCAWYNYTDVVGDDANHPRVNWPLDVLNDNETDAPSEIISWPVNPSLWNFTHPLNETAFMWTNLSHVPQGEEGKASIGALMTIPDTFEDPDDPSRPCHLYKRSFIVPCTVRARWTLAEFSYDPKNNDLVSGNSSMNITTMASEGNFSKPISISTEWADLLIDNRASVTNELRERNLTAIQGLLSSFNSIPASSCTSPSNPRDETYRQLSPIARAGIPKMIAALLADGLARSNREETSIMVPRFILDDGKNNLTYGTLAFQNNEKLRDIKTMCVETSRAAKEDMKNSLLNGSTVFDTRIERYGYGYGYKDKPTVAFGLTVMFIYTTIVVIHLLLLVYESRRRNAFSSGAWGDMGEMLALALVSKKSDGLGNVSGGVKSKKTWTSMTRVRENEEGVGLELVVGSDDAVDSMAKKGKKYA